MAARHHLSESERAHIASLKASGESTATIAQQTGVPVRTVRHTLERLRDSGTLHDLPRSGRPRKLKAKDMRDIPQLLKRDHLRTSLDIQQHLHTAAAVDVSRSTILRRLKEMDIKSYRLSASPLLTRGNVKKRLK